jgi:hypothetical protein
MASTVLVLSSILLNPNASRGDVDQDICIVSIEPDYFFEATLTGGRIR